MKRGGKKREKQSKQNLKIILFLGIFILLAAANLYSLFFLLPESKGITGNGITASVTFSIMGENKTINITHPLNQTYNFAVGSPYNLGLNVTSNFNVDTWWYSLWDMRHNELIYYQVIFTPNTTFEAVRWNNKLIVFANDSAQTVNDTVEFFINVPNSAPFITGLPSNILICEGEYLSQLFNATDVDEDNLIVGITPTNPFYTLFAYNVNYTTDTYEIFSGLLTKDNAGGINSGSELYQETVYANDGEYIDTADLNITVVEKNNAPNITNIGVQTVWTRGSNSTFYYQVNASDVEDGNQNSGNLNFTINFTSGRSLFNISATGLMNYTGNASDVGVYNISVCVNDTGIDNPYSTILSVCGQTGAAIKVCNNFSLTVTNENRPPTITAYSPENLTFSASGTSSIYFNITSYDPDLTVPDVYWYIDNVLREYDSGYSRNNFTFAFECGVSGTHTAKVEITDGDLNDSIEWNISVQQTSCPVVSSSSGGGGGGTGKGCNEKWGCGLWSVCQNAKSSLDAGVLSGNDYRNIQTECNNGGLNEITCGVQIRSCVDTNNCGTQRQKPAEFQSCIYTELPGCKDKIKNCHDGSCELLIDCGGPCAPCATCSDKIRNQGEDGIDCGGPCPWKCPEEEPLLKKQNTLYIILILLIILILILIITIRSIIRYKKKL